MSGMSADDQQVLQELMGGFPGAMAGLQGGLGGLPGGMPGLPGGMGGMPGMNAGMAGMPGMSAGMGGMPGMSAGMGGMPGMPAGMGGFPTGIPGLPAGMPGMPPGMMRPGMPGGMVPGMPGGMMPGMPGGMMPGMPGGFTSSSGPQSAEQLLAQLGLAPALGGQAAQQIALMQSQGEAPTAQQTNNMIMRAAKEGREQEKKAALDAVQPENLVYGLVLRNALKEAALCLLQDERRQLRHKGLEILDSACAGFDEPDAIAGVHRLLLEETYETWRSEPPGRCQPDYAGSRELIREAVAVLANLFSSSPGANVMFDETTGKANPAMPEVLPHVHAVTRVFLAGKEEPIDAGALLSKQERQTNKPPPKPSEAKPAETKKR